MYLNLIIEAYRTFDLKLAKTYRTLRNVPYYPGANAPLGSSDVSSFL